MHEAPRRSGWAAATPRRDAAVEGRWWVDDDGPNAKMPLPLRSELLGIFLFGIIDLKYDL